jgi:hypothetical protein
MEMFLDRSYFWILCSDGSFRRHFLSAGNGNRSKPNAYVTERHILAARLLPIKAQLSTTPVTTGPQKVRSPCARAASVCEPVVTSVVGDVVFIVQNAAGTKPREHNVCDVEAIVDEKS